MKLHELPQPLLLVCVGYPGAGKSTFAAHMAVSQRLVWIHGNRIRHILFAKPQFSAQEEALVDELGRYMLAEALRTKAPIVFDAQANTKATRQQIRAAAEAAGYKVLVVWVQTDVETARSRAKRSREGEFAPALSPSQFDKFVSQFYAPEPSEYSVVLSGKHTFATQQRTLGRKIDLLLRGTSQPQPAPSKATKQIQIASSDTEKPAEPARSRPRFDITRHIKFR